MTFLEWISINMIIDISFLVFAGAVIWKLKKFNNKIKSLEKKLLATMRNPKAAKRLLKEKQ